MLPNEPRPPKCFRDAGFDLKDFRADEEVARQLYRAVGTEAESLAEHHTADGVHSYYVLLDRTATWGIPGEPQLIAVHLQRDWEQRTFIPAYSVLPLPQLAQSWLIRRGCPPDALQLDAGSPQPADWATRDLASRLVRDGTRYVMRESYTDDHNDVVVVVLEDPDAQARAPFRVVVEEFDVDAMTFTLREGAFAEFADASVWCWERIVGEAGPLPPVRPAAAPRTAAPPTAPAVSRAPGRAP
ncbi:hypothetical protein [Streptomyces sp. NPDC046860]|uniref:hypothetical protein n=1 Tax=Streptomyces sp. NPDC046860 TaxID=3154495 RepID=UPI00340B8197